MRGLITAACAMGLLVLGCGGLGGLLQTDDGLMGITIGTAYPGASPEEVEYQITMPIEASVAAEPGVVSIESRSVEGASWVTAWYAPDETDPYALKASLLERLVQGGADLPEDAEPSLLLGDAEPQARLLTRVALSGAQGWERCARDLLDAAQTVPGVERAVATGIDGPRVVIQADPARLAAYGLGGQDLAAGLSATEAHPTGALIRVPTYGALRLEELADVVIAVQQDVPVRLSDLATIRLERDPAAPVVLLDGMPGGLLSVYHRPGANQRTVRESLARAMQPVELRCGQGLFSRALPPGERVRALELVLPAAGSELTSLAEPLAQIATQAGAETVLLELGSPDPAGLGWTTTQHARLILRYAEPPQPDPIPALVQAVQALPEIAIRGWEGPGSRVELLLRGPDQGTVHAAAEPLAQALRTLGGAVAVDDGSPPLGPTVDVYADRERLAALGLTQSQLAQAVRAAVSCLPVGRVDAGGEPVELTLCVGDASIDRLGEFPLTTPGGDTVPLGAVASIELSTAPAARTRWDMTPALILAVTSDEPSERRLRDAVLELIAQQALPAGVSVELER